MIDDQALAEAARKVETAILRGIPEDEHQFSRRFERKMDRLLRRAAHPGLYRCLRAAACAALALLLAGTMVFALHGEARAKTLGWLRQKQQGVVEYFFPSQPQPDSGPMTEYYPQWLPKGYHETEKYEDDNLCSVIYHNDWNLKIDYMLIRGSEGIKSFLYAGDAVPQFVSINGQQGIYYEGSDDNGHNSITWESEDGNYLFLISGYLSKIELVRMAESVQVEK